MSASLTGDAGRQAPETRAIAGPVRMSSQTAFDRWIPAVLFHSLLIPAGISVSLGSLVLFPYRILLLALVPWIGLRMSRPDFRFNFVDGLVLIAGLWLVIALIANMGFGGAWQAGGREFIDLVGGYFLMRASIRSVADVERLVKLISPALVVVGLILAVESISHRAIIAEIFPLTGRAQELALEVRLGMIRAWGPFSHPILGGLIMASLLPVYALWRGRTARKAAGVFATLCAFFTISSAAIMSLVMSGGLAIYAWVMMMNYRKPNWQFIVYPLIGMVVVMQLFTQSGAARLIIRYLALNPSTGNFRLLIWDYGTASVALHPWFGIGYTDYQRAAWMVTGSIDNYWLLLAMHYGMVAPFSLIFAVIVTVAKMEQRRRKSPYRQVDWAYFGLQISISVLAMLLITVAATFQAQVWFLSLLGIGCSLAYRAPDPLPVRPPRQVDMRQALSHHRKQVPA